MNTRLDIFHHGRDINDEIELRNGRSNPFGWSYHEVFAKDDWDQMVKIGEIYCGAPQNFIEGFTYTLTPIADDAAMLAAAPGGKEG